MNNAMDQDHALLGAYSLGVLEPAEAAEFERRHLTVCAQCRHELDELAALRHDLDEVPPEAFLDGPPEGGDLLLRRALHRVRDEETEAVPRFRPRRKPRALVAAAVVLLAVVTLGAGWVIGRQTAPTAPAAAPTSTPAPRQLPPATDPATGASLDAKVLPFAGWVKVQVRVGGIPEGEQCQLQVVSKKGARVGAGSWRVSAKWEREGFTLDGAALVSPEDVVSVDIVTMDGRKLVSAPATA
ncbi:zf-HC2 domain-containing protein [Amycolatopsis samaneae]|uniref:Zf-HC2 domain-containing protein n=1 Tax=Amycolatopsis samaneae TaxID=664691 RepID=A0ABW5GWP9_9PSEU